MSSNIEKLSKGEENSAIDDLIQKITQDDIKECDVLTIKFRRYVNDEAIRFCSGAKRIELQCVLQERALDCGKNSITRVEKCFLYILAPAEYPVPGTRGNSNGPNTPSSIQGSSEGSALFDPGLNRKINFLKV